MSRKKKKKKFFWGKKWFFLIRPKQMDESLVKEIVLAAFYQSPKSKKGSKLLEHININIHQTQPRSFNLFKETPFHQTWLNTFKLNSTQLVWTIDTTLSLMDSLLLE